jgi:hypothetical protein
MVIDCVLVEVKGLADRSCRKIKVKRIQDRNG